MTAFPISNASSKGFAGIVRTSAWLLLLGLCQCGSSNEAPPGLSGPGTTQKPAPGSGGSGQTPITEPDAGTKPDATDSMPPGNTDEDFSGELEDSLDTEVVLLDPTKCTAANDEPVLLLPGSSSTPAYTQIGSVGGRRFAHSQHALKLFTFADENTLSTTLQEVVSVSSTASFLDALFATETGLLLQKYNADLAPVGSGVSLAVELPSGVSNVSNESTRLVSFFAGTKLRFAFYADAQAIKSGSFELDGSPGRAKAHAVNGSFALTWTEYSDAARGVLRFGSVNPNTEQTAPITVAKTLPPMDLVDVQVGAQGYVALFQTPLPDSRAVIIRFSHTGVVLSPTYYLAGPVRALSLGAHTDWFAVAIQSSDAAAALGRVVNGQSSAEWVCYEMSSAGNVQFVFDTQAGALNLYQQPANRSLWQRALPWPSPP
jgi:hypothetical protein